MTVSGSKRRLGGECAAIALAATLSIGLLLSIGMARADDYCCPCKNKPQSIEADDKATATAQCSLVCKRFVLAKSGRCEGDAPAAAAPPAAAPPAAGSSTAVALFKTDDCSGEATTVTASSGRLAEGYLSFQGESGESVQVWEKPDFAGAATQPVGPGICVSPGWSISGIRIGK